MAVLVEVTFPATAEQYDAVDKAVDGRGNPPDGFIAHSARVDGDNISVIDIWESPEAFGAFAESRLGEGIAGVMGDDAPQVEPKFTELHNAYTA